MPIIGCGRMILQKEDKMKTYFNFCGVYFEINSEIELWEHTDLFKTEKTTADVKVNLHLVDNLPEPSGKYLGRANEKEAWQDKNTVYRRTTDICKDEPHVQINYSCNNCKNINSNITSDAWQWATTEKYLWTSLCLNQIMLYFNTLFFHASYIEVNGEGILFTAPSQTGKSTQAALWEKYRGAKVVNGDKAAVRIEDIVTVNSIPFSGTSGICENITVPLKAIVFLSQAPENRVRKMGASEAITALCPNVFADKLVGEEWSQTLNLLLNLVSTVPIYHLACTPDERAVETLEKEFV